MTRFILTFLFIFNMPEETFKGVRISLEGGAGRPLGQDGPSAEIWLTATNAVRRIRLFALPDSVVVENCYGRYSGGLMFLDKSQCHSTVWNLCGMQWNRICFCLETSNPLSNDHKSF